MTIWWLYSDSCVHTPKSFIFQHDGDHKHAANIIKLYFKETGINVPDLVAKSPGLNQNANLWSDLDQRIFNSNLTSKNELKRGCDYFINFDLGYTMIRTSEL